jgi:hypothetical protein
MNAFISSGSRTSGEVACGRVEQSGHVVRGGTQVNVEGEYPPTFSKHRNSSAVGGKTMTILDSPYTVFTEPHSQF